jgi:hypothetical protein
MLAGASYLDLLVTYEVSFTKLYEFFHECIGWINVTFSFPLVEYLKHENTTALTDISNGFSNKSEDIFSGFIGAVDGMAIQIKCPTTSNDEVPDPGNYYCRKGFYALNIQCICDSKKRIIWLSTGHKGSTHDSMAFSETKLNTLLQEKKDYLYKHRLFIAGDSAYPLFSYLIVPYPNAESNSFEDAFNYWHSSSRINIECTFGELVMRWGILWRRLQFSLRSAGSVINACSHLHNFLVDERENDNLDDFKTNVDNMTEDV